MSIKSTIPVSREFPFTDKDFRFLAGLASSKTGIVLAEQKRDMVYGRLARRLRALDLASFEEYCALLESPEGEDELVHLVNAITTNLTSFFREAHHFEHLKNEIVKPLTAAGQRRLRIWSAGCSSGMEPYSLAMTLRDAVPDLKNWDVRILATDIDSNILAIGQAGEYAAADGKSIPDAYHRWVHPAAAHRIQMDDSLKQQISFKQLNLLEPWPMQGPFDVIFCRNVVIYFDKPTKQKLFDRFADILKPGGWLYIGHSENMHGMCDRFELLGRTIYRKIK